MKRDRDYYIQKALDMTVAEVGAKIHTAMDAHPLLKPWGMKREENFLVMTLNGNHEVIKIHHITKGILNKTVVHPREVFRTAIQDSAASIIICHNHPSGQLEPSEEDKSVTKRLRDAGELIGIAVLDHIIEAKGAYYSFVEMGI